MSSSDPASSDSPSASLRLLVAGPERSGKTTLIRSLSAANTVVTVAFDYGRLPAGDRTLHLYGAPEPGRFAFMHETLSREVDGALLLADATQRSAPAHLKHLLGQLQKAQERVVPYVIGVTHADCFQDGDVPDRLAALARAARHIQIADPRDRSSCQHLLRALLHDLHPA
jgi:signal recognition particle receptor subunit beta